MSKKIIEKEYLTLDDYNQIKELESLCLKSDKTALKLELEYKLSISKNNAKSRGEVNDYITYIDNKVVAYISLCSFGGQALEINGMVDPNYRRQGLFTELFLLVKEEIGKRKPKSILLLSDNNSVSGLGFIKENKGQYKLSEYEMYLDQETYKNIKLDRGLLVLRKATNLDSDEIRKQNAVYFASDIESVSITLPEEEAKQNFFIYMAEVDGKVIGKTNINYLDGFAGIYGLGILPAYRGKGFGRELLNKSVEKSLEMNANDIMLQVEVENTNALNLYTSVGFKVRSTMDYYSLCQESK